ncbi:MAG: hypothetical protein KBT31_06415 [Firmicutes bacterium]|nr:hypothetical protein [Candidatus Colimorpha enterica]
MAEQNKSAEMLELFRKTSIKELEQMLRDAKSREETVFFRTLINLKLQSAQEQIVGEFLL